MGFSISWLAFKGLSKAEVLKRTGFRDSGAYDEANESPLFPGGTADGMGDPLLQ